MTRINCPMERPLNVVIEIPTQLETNRLHEEASWKVSNG
jgi:hypothetical protein